MSFRTWINDYLKMHIILPRLLVSRHSLDDYSE